MMLVGPGVSLGPPLFSVSPRASNIFPRSKIERAPACAGATPRLRYKVKEEESLPGDDSPGSGAAPHRNLPHLLEAGPERSSKE